MILFDEIERNDTRRKLYAEPDFHYLNYSARPEATRIRNVLEQWFSNYPSEYRKRLRQDLRSRNDYNHLAAFYELYLHELLIRLGCRVAIHPDLTNTSRNPDFLVYSPKDSRFILEAAVVLEESRKEAGTQARIFNIYDQINRKIKSEKYFIDVEVNQTSKINPRISEIVSLVRKKLDEIDYGKMMEIAQSDNYQELPKWTWEGNGWEIELSIIPKKREAIGEVSGPIIGISSEGVKLARSREKIRNAVVRKAGRYGELGIPYVLAVNAVLTIIDIQDIEDALFGDEVWHVPITDSGPGIPLPDRKPNGAWIDERGPRYTRVSALLLSTRLSPWTVARAPIRLFHNPWAKRRYRSVLTCLPQWELKAEKRHMVDGQSPCEILDLPKGWPE